MGVISSLAGQIAKMFASSPEQRILRLTSGNVSDDGGLLGGYATIQQFGASRLGEYLRLDAGLIERYNEAEFMDEYPELASALDIYADDATQPDLQNTHTIWASSPRPNIDRELNRMFRRIGADDHNWEMARATAKYGDDYEEILVDGSGVIGLHYMPPITVRRIEGRYGELYGFLQDPRGGVNLSVQDWQRAMSNRTDISQQYLQPDQMIAFEPWEVAHFRLRTKYRQSKTGQSILEPARWIWRRLVLLEDCAMVYRLHRAPERLNFNINVGNKDGLEAQAILNRYRQMYRKKRFVNPATGKLEMRFEQLSQDDDIYLAFQDGKEPSSVNLLSAPQWQSVDDLDYFKQKLYAAIKIPSAYMGDPDGVVRNVLSQQDIRFARSVMRLQRAMREGWGRVCDVHLAALGIPVDRDRFPYEVHMTAPSSIIELAQLEAKSARADLASRMGDFVSLHWILANIFNLSDPEIETIFTERHADQIRDGKTQAEVQELMQPEGGEGDQAYESTEFHRLRRDARRTEAGARARRIGWKLPSVRQAEMQGRGPRPVTEEQLFRGSKETERRAHETVEKLMAHDKAFAGRIQELSALLHELRGAAAGSRARGSRESR